MSVIDSTLVEVNLEACNRVAAWLAENDIPPDSEETSLAGFSPVEVGDFYLFLVAICHQTTPRGKPPLVGIVDSHERRGWDYLLHRFEERARNNRDLLTPSSWSTLTSGGLQEIFTDKKYGSRLIEIDRRAELIRNLGQVMEVENWSHLDDLYRASGGRVASGSPNLVDLLGRFEAYRDPVRKKSFFLLALMRNNRLWQYVDPDRLGPPVDYHEIRGHLRLGTVAVVHDALRAKLLAHLPVSESEDLAIRRAVFQAIMQISERSRLRNPTQLHYLFWNVFRSCCQRDNPHCDGCPPDCALPDRYVPLALGPDVRGCPFRTVCEAAKIPANRDLVEHTVSSQYDYH